MVNKRKYNLCEINSETEAFEAHQFKATTFNFYNKEEASISKKGAREHI